MEARTRSNTVWVLGAAAAVAVGAYLTVRYLRQRKVENVMHEYRHLMQLPRDHLQAIRDEFARQLKEGLTTNGISSLMMLPTMVDILPNGHESGIFYAIDIGGTNFRVLSVHLTVERGVVGEVKMKDGAIPKPLKKRPVAELFDFVATSVVEFARESDPSLGSPGHHLVLGFCFSFPMTQTSLESGRLIQWTKGFDNAGGVGADPVVLLKEAFQRKGVEARVAALLNDSVGVLSAGRYADEDTMVGLIQGTGTNACYVEQVANIQRLPEKGTRRTQQMVINTEWGNFESALLPLGADDWAMDATTVNAGKYHFEKLSSGMYMGDVARRIIWRLTTEAQLFGGRVPAVMQEAWQFRTPVMAQIHSDETADLCTTAELLEEAFGLPAASISFAVRRQVQEVCALVAQRGASLIAAAIAALVHHMGRDVPATSGKIPKTVVAVDGSVFEKYDKYRETMMRSLDIICGPEVAARIELKFTPDGSALGAAFLAASVAHNSN